MLELPFGGGTFELEAGDFSHVYAPDRPLRGQFSTNTPIGVLLENPKIRAMLVKMMPQITQLPVNMASMSMRQMASKMGGRLTVEVLDQIDNMLGQM